MVSRNSGSSNNASICLSPECGHNFGPFPRHVPSIAPIHPFMDITPALEIAVTFELTPSSVTHGHPHGLNAIGITIYGSEISWVDRRDLANLITVPFSMDQVYLSMGSPNQCLWLVGPREPILASIYAFLYLKLETRFQTCCLTQHWTAARC